MLGERSIKASKINRNEKILGTEEVYILDTKHNDRKMQVYVELFT